MMAIRRALFLSGLLIYISDVYGQSSGDGKRKASEYFCVAQCLGLLNPGGLAPGAASCYGAAAGATPSTCGGVAFHAGFTTCCKDHPMEIVKSTFITDKCKAFMAPPGKMLQGYVVNAGLEVSGKFDLTADGGLIKKFSKQSCFIECLFQEAKILAADGLSINYDEAKKIMMAAVSDPWKPMVDTSVTACTAQFKTSYASVAKVKAADVASACSPVAMLFHQCVRRQLLLQCPTTKTDSADCKQWDTDVRGCDIFK